jgi:hypothetical protein
MMAWNFSSHDKIMTRYIQFPIMHGAPSHSGETLALQLNPRYSVLLEKWRVAQLVMNSSTGKKPTDPLTCSQEPARRIVVSTTTTANAAATTITAAAAVATVILPK